eukprot:TRINITY_DN8529_c0_g1_i1.p1 TRINITY_DN8529_c0_g1~~TRINITY_DN8529_c0_g1_i1.p1  ORF type:complete len:286 (+),score=11.35 TRINITY_DN8529_c0_g1_i1:68-925(+)
MDGEASPGGHSTTTEPQQEGPIAAELSGRQAVGSRSGLRLSLPSPEPTSRLVVPAWLMQGLEMLDGIVVKRDIDCGFTKICDELWLGASEQYEEEDELRARKVTDIVNVAPEAVEDPKLPGITYHMIDAYDIDMTGSDCSAFSPRPGVHSPLAMPGVYSGTTSPCGIPSEGGTASPVEGPQASPPQQTPELSTVESGYPLIPNHLKDFRDIVTRVRDSGGVCFANCARGVNRSAAMCVAYLMTEKGMDLASAARHVATQRPVILTNTAFRVQLVRLAHEHGLLIV